MKSNIHPTYGPVAFKDITTGKIIITQSTLNPAETIEYEGKTYPLVSADVTSDSHPFWTGSNNTVDTEGRVAAFERRYGKKVS